MRIGLSVGSFGGNWCQFGSVTHHSYIYCEDKGGSLPVTISAYYTRWRGCKRRGFLGVNERWLMTDELWSDQSPWQRKHHTGMKWRNIPTSLSKTMFKMYEEQLNNSLGQQPLRIEA